MSWLSLSYKRALCYFGHFYTPLFLFMLLGLETSIKKKIKVEKKKNRQCFHLLYFEFDAIIKNAFTCCVYGRWGYLFPLNSCISKNRLAKRRLSAHINPGVRAIL